MNNNDPYKVLIAEDNEAHVHLIYEILTAPDFVVTAASDGLSACALANEEDFDVILLDKRMPGMSGDEVCQKIRESGNSLVPVMIVTGSAYQEDLSHSLQCGATDFIRKPFDIDEFFSRVTAAARFKRASNQLDNAADMLFTLARMVEAKDPCTGDHCSRLEYQAQVFGEVLGLSSAEIEALQKGGILHDIGKLAIPDSILTKPGSLTDEEWVLMKQHTVIGAHLCGNLKSIQKCVPIIHYHHERWDGSGYPEQLKGEDIPLLARVFQTIDIYDALAHERPYKKAMSTEKIIAIFREEIEKGWRDPYLTNIFIGILENDPQSLVMPDSLEKTNDQLMFDAIKDTGVIQWLHRDNQQQEPKPKQKKQASN